MLIQGRVPIWKSTPREVALPELEVSEIGSPLRISFDAQQAVGEPDVEKRQVGEDQVVLVAIAEFLLEAISGRALLPRSSAHRC